jgi:hypothetical protein
LLIPHVSSLRHVWRKVPTSDNVQEPWKSKWKKKLIRSHKPAKSRSQTLHEGIPTARMKKEMICRQFTDYPAQDVLDTSKRVYRVANAQHPSFDPLRVVCSTILTLIS